MPALTVAAVWAFAEATLFFIVPDVWLTRLALRNPRLALWACLVATVAAVVGGSLMFAAGVRAPTAAEAALEAVPGIFAGTVADVNGELRESGPIAMIWGPATGTPYKIYAVEAGRIGLAPAEFVGASVIARLPRFLILTLAAGALTALFRPLLPKGAPEVVHAVLWLAFYAAYFLRVGW